MVLKVYRLSITLAMAVSLVLLSYVVPKADHPLSFGGISGVLSSYTSGVPLNPSVNDPGDIKSVLGSSACSAAASQSCEMAVMGALNLGRASMGLSPYQLPFGFYQLAPESQLLLLINQDRATYGLAPIMGFLPGLNQAARSGALNNQDPNVGANQTVNGANLVAVGSNWYGSTVSSNALVVYYIWMYDDGFGSSNLGCPEPGFPGCWMHRDNLLLGGGGSNGVFMGMGQSSNPEFSYSFAVVVAGGTYASGSSLPVEDPYSELNSSVSADAAGDQGYWLVAADGGVFSFGDANFYGSMGGQHLNAPVVGMASTPDGKGYWLVAADGGVFSFGDATFDGSLGGTALGELVVGISSTHLGGYLMVTGQGSAYDFGEAVYLGSADLYNLNEPIVGAAVVSS
jgi:hypothetical protein